MGMKIFELPRYKRPLWEALTFAAALAGLVGLAVFRVTMDKAIAAQPGGTPTATAGYSQP